MTAATKRQQESLTQHVCEYYGKKHSPGPRRCPAFGKTCAKCGGKNRWAAGCKGGRTRRERLLDSDPEKGTEEFLVIDSVLIGNLDDVTRPAGRCKNSLKLARVW